MVGERQGTKPAPWSAERPAGEPLVARGQLGIPDPPSSVPNWSRPIIPALLVVLLLVTGLRSLRAGVGARRAAQERALLASYVDILQRTLVPDPPGWMRPLDLGGLLPAEGPGAGGDFYDVFELGDGRVGLILGDARDTAAMRSSAPH